jgi:ABC-type glycerol-3-phosphate transport system permease component
VSILALIWVWGELLFAIVLMTKPEAKTLPVGLLGFRGQYFTDLGVLFAGLTIATGPIVLAYLLFQRRVTKGVTLGAFR